MRYPTLEKKRKEAKLSYEDMSHLCGVQTERLKKSLAGRNTLTDKELHRISVFCFPESSIDELKQGSKTLRKAS